MSILHRWRACLTKQNLKNSHLFNCFIQSKAIQWMYRAGECLDKYSFLWQVFFVVVYRLSLDLLYVNSLSPLYAYAGFTTELQLLPYLLSLMLVVVMAPFVAQVQEQCEDNSASAAILTVFHYIYFIPLTSYMGCWGMNLSFFLISMLYWGLLLFWHFRLPVLNLVPLSIKHTQKWNVFLTVGAVMFVLLISGKYTGFRFTLDFINVYGIRAEAASYQMPIICSTLLSMMHIVLAYLILYWLQRKKYGLVTLLVFVELLHFSIGAHKSQFFFLLLVVVGYFLYRRWIMKWLGLLLSGVALVALLEEKIFGSIYFISFFFRRMMYIPIQISEQCSRVFSENPLNLFRYGIMGKFSFENIYSLTIPQFVAEAAGEVSNSNNGLVGDLFTNVPAVLGLLLLPLMLVICFRLLDMVSFQISPRYTMAFCVLFANSFVNSSWSIVLCSHGFLLTCILLYLFTKEEEYSL